MNNVNRESDFWRFMQSEGPTEKKSKGNYISWLRFVSGNFCEIDESLDTEKVDEICTELREKVNQRNVYKTSDDTVNSP